MAGHAQQQGRLVSDLAVASEAPSVSVAPNGPALETGGEHAERWERVTDVGVKYYPHRNTRERVTDVGVK